MTNERAYERFKRLVIEFNSRGWEHIQRGRKEARDLNFIKHDRKDIEETIDVLHLIRDRVESAARRSGLEYKLPPGWGKGRPTVGCKDLAKAVLVQQYFRTGYRKTARLIALFKETLNIEKSFSYKTIERAYGKPRVEKILEEIHSVVAWTPPND